MKAIDLETYQTLNKTLIQQQQHPYQPYQSISNHDQTITKDLYITIKKTVQRRTAQQEQNPHQIITQSFQFQKNYDEVVDPSLQDNLPRFNTDDLLKHPQLFIIHPQSKKQLQSTLDGKTIKKTQQMTLQQQQLNDNQCISYQNKQLVLKDLFAKQQIPIKQQNYFENIGGFEKFYNLKSPKSITLPSKRYPFIFVSNFSLLFSLFLGFQLNDRIIWMVFAGILVTYILISYHSEVRHKLFSMRQMKQLQSELEKLKKVQGHFLFNIECFHYTCHGNREQKVVSYRKTKKLVPFKSQDNSAEASILQSQGDYIDLSYKNQCYMIDKDSEARFMATFNQFVTKHKQDVHQKYSFSFQTSSQSKLKGIYCHRNTFSHIICIFFTFTCLLFPFALWFESRNTRQQIKIIKRLTIK